MTASHSTIINKITTNTVEIASIRIYARALQSSVEIARLGPAAHNDALTVRTADSYPLSAATRAPRHLAVPRGLPERLRQPRDFDGDPSRLVLCQHLRPPRFGLAPSGVNVWERLPVGVVNPVRRPAANEEYQRMDGTRDRSGRSKSGTPSRRRSRLRRPEPS
jgi:hypothetical protein